jgi:predicted nucleic acid-binding protein
VAGKERTSVFLDTCALLRWIGREGDDGATAIHGILHAISDKKINAVISSLTKLEILECKNDATMFRAWKNLQARTNVEVFGVHKGIINTAYDIRNYYQSMREKDASQKKPPQQPDCLLIATAIVAGVDHFMTYDSGKKDPKCLSPLELNGTIAGQWRLNIVTAEKLNMAALAV